MSSLVYEESMSKGRTKHYIPTAIQMRHAACEYMYELAMLRLTCRACFYLSQYNPNEEMLKNAMIESSLIHARNLMDFFCGGETHKDDIRACHFVKATVWQPPKLKYLCQMKEKINKHLSHLTYSRTSEKVHWNLRRIETEIEEANKRFLAALQEAEADQWQARITDRDGARARTL